MQNGCLHHWCKVTLTFLMQNSDPLDSINLPILRMDLSDKHWFLSINCRLDQWSDGIYNERITPGWSLMVDLLVAVGTRRKASHCVSKMISMSYIMTSWNGNSFHVTSHLCGESPEDSSHKRPIPPAWWIFLFDFLQFYCLLRCHLY